MVIYFQEVDLINFGNFLLSDMRKAYYQSDKTIDQDKLDEYLKEVHNTDLAIFGNLLQQENNK